MMYNNPIMPYEQNLYGNQFLGMQGLPIMPEMYGA